jgi:ABC-type glycerol-3-phosphate transport system permease component
MSVNLYKLIIDINWINTFWALIVPSLSNGMVIFMFRQYFLGFPNYMIEAAMIDGLPWPKILLHIVFPSSKPICISAGLILFITQWESFLWPVLVTRTSQMHTIQIALSSFQTEHAKLWNNIFAASIIAFIIPILIILPLQKYFIEGISSVGSKE